ncbi:hypothetical protein DM860_016493 [Cuscuta australis]|uniref:F-box domain-containing protein n=1 Tax=Cuscuta australis TaxID=267555 RepID=A0A328E251_9ASTE|nr:hypothetical protein DM860_016493 [Cuscuta australis]
MTRPSPANRRLCAERVESNDELLTKILLLQPESTLVQLKLVCKRWFALISDPYFRFLYATSKSSPPSIYLSLYPSYLAPKLLYYSVPLTGNNRVAVQKGIRYGDIKSSCNGLVVLKFGNDLFVSNPTTNFVTQLPLHNIL